MIGRPSQRSGNGWEALPKGWEKLGGPPKGPGVVGRPSQSSGSDREALAKSKSGWETLPKFQKWSVGPPTGLGVVGRPFRKSSRLSRRSRSDRKVLL